MTTTSRQRDPEEGQVHHTSSPPTSSTYDEESFDSVHQVSLEDEAGVDTMDVDGTGKSEASLDAQNEPFTEEKFQETLTIETFSNMETSEEPIGPENLWDKVKELVGEVEPIDDSILAEAVQATTASTEASAEEEESADLHAIDEEDVFFDSVVGDVANDTPSDDMSGAQDFDSSSPMDVDCELATPPASEPILKPLPTDEIMMDDAIMQDDDESFGDSSNDEDDYELVPRAHDKGIDIRALASILDSAKKATRDIDLESDVVLVLGGTGTGKSTFIQAVAGHKFKIGWDQSLHRDCFVVDGEGEQGFEIGEGMRSRTRHARSFFRESSSTFYVDSSGFGDTEGIETDIATSICVKDIASRCRRMRFVVLINAYSFFHNRGTELRKSLDLVANFVGDNFNTYRQSFTFLFTHCNKAFDSVPSKTEQDCPAVTNKVLAAMREELKALLKSLKSETTDIKQKNLAEFLYISLKKGYPYCDIFDPILSNVLQVVEGVEPATSKTCISEPAQHVKCSLTNDSKSFLSHELSKRQEAVLYRIGEDVYDEELQEDVRAVFTLNHHIGDICQGPSSALHEALMRCSVRLEDRIFSIAHRGLLDDGSSIFTLEDANSLKAAIENLACIEILSPVQRQVRQRP